MERILTSFRFLAATALCCAVVVAGTTWLLGDAAGGARLLAALIALAATLSVMVLIAWAVAAEGEAPVPVPATAPAVVVAPAPAPAKDVQIVLGERLAAGRSLGEELDPSASDPRVDAWIADVRQTLEREKQGLVGYFDALSHRAYADDRARLEAYTRRLATIVRDLL